MCTQFIKLSLKEAFVVRQGNLNAYSMNKYTQSTYCVPGPVLGSEAFGMVSPADLALKCSEAPDIGVQS